MSVKLSAFIVGATGQVGKAISKELAQSESFDKVTLFARKEIDPAQGDKTNDYSKFEVKVVDFDKLSENHAGDFEGYDVGFCTLGTLGGVSEEIKKRVDHGYAVESAKLAKAGGCKQFSVLTAMFANKDSSSFPFRIKGLIEADITAIEFQRLSIWRTYQLVNGDRNSRSVLSAILGPVDCFRLISCDVSVLARAMVQNSLTPSDKAVEIFENREINRMGATK